MGDTWTAKELYELVGKIECCTTPSTYYYFLGGMHQHWAGISNEYIIEFFKDCSDVVLIDPEDRRWCKGKRIYDNKEN